MAGAANEDRYIVPGLVRGLAVLRLFTPERPVLSLSEIAELLGITRSAAFRTVYTLAEDGCLLGAEGERGYALGPGVLRLTYGYVATREIVEIAQPELQRLRTRTGWSSHLGVLDGSSVLYVLRIAAPQRDGAIVQIGSRLPAKGTVLGRVLLAGLAEDDLIALYRSTAGRNRTPLLPGIIEQARRDAQTGTVIHTGDFEAGIVSCAAPVHDLEGRVVAAISLTAPKTAENTEIIRGPILDDLKAAAERISRMMGWHSRR